MTRRTGRRTSPLALASLLVLALALSGARCPSALYFLEEGEGGSAWVEGCIEGPCLCPVSQAELTGTFRLRELPTLAPGPERLFEIAAIDWEIGTGPGARRVTGSGWYTTSAHSRDDQRLVLELEIDGDPIGTIDSGVVAGGLSFPRIEIAALTSGVCFQSGVVLRATPILALRHF